MRTARRMGIGTVAVYSDADRDALHVEMADEGVYIGGSPSVESYLRGDAIVAACQRTGAEAVHPGYGFLSENAAFAAALEAAGIVFVGPDARAITAMGDKIEAKRLAGAAGVATIPGHAGALEGAEHAVEVARGIGYPVMLKASAGGGGKGMRIVRDDTECREGFERASSEARSSFGDERVFAEKFIERPRHIEIQVLADGRGDAIYLGERECSLQRRHQKVIEETPSPFLDAATREAMGEQAVALAKAVGYRSAGTVEFVVDAARRFYFLEMNTRLQVEHAVTECVTGLDLVEWMIRIAAGEPLGITQADVNPTGWAIEARVYAEDPFRNFLPSIGRLVRYRAPPESDHVRVDTGFAEGGEVSVYYDPMIAKVIASGESREEAIGHLRDALDGFYIDGVSHNISFLQALVGHPRFAAGDTTTDFIGEEYPDGFHPADVPHEQPAVPILVAAVINRRYVERAARISGQLPGHEHRVSDDWVVRVGGENHAVVVRAVVDGYRVVLDGEEHTVRGEWRFGEPLFEGAIDDRPVRVQVQRDRLLFRLFHRGAQVDAMVLKPAAARLLAHMPEKAPQDSSRLLLSPMPGLLVGITVRAGQEVKVGEALAVVEAMKMENVLRAERDATVAAVLASVGDSLVVDQPIVEFE